MSQLVTKGPKGQIYIWPSYRFGPDGEKRLFDKPEDVPADFGRSPPDNPVAKATTPPPPADDSLDDLKKSELIALAEEEHIDLDAIEGSGKNGNVLVDDIRDAIREKRK